MLARSLKVGTMMLSSGAGRTLGVSARTNGAAELAAGISIAD
jgi:hypothetical protein